MSNQHKDHPKKPSTPRPTDSEKFDQQSIENEIREGVRPDNLQEAGDYYDVAFGGLDTRQQNAILALMTEPDIKSAAKRANLDPRTIYRWLQKEDFSKAYREARKLTFLQSISLCQRYLPLAINIIAQVMVDMRSPASSRVSGAAQIIKFARGSIEIDDLLQRIEALEKSQQEREGMSPRKNSWSAVP